MRIEIRNDSVEIDGYVNAVERQSNPVITPYGKVIEIIEQRAFEKGLGRAENVDLLLDHDENVNLGSTASGNLKLWEDNIGLRAVCTVTDPNVIQLAKDGKLQGWSFGMVALEDTIEQRGEGELPIRRIKDLDILEVSIIDDKMNPCYSATSIETRAEGNVQKETRAWVDTYVTVTDRMNIWGDTENDKMHMTKTKEITVTENQEIDYSEYEQRINKLKQGM